MSEKTRFLTLSAAEVRWGGGQGRGVGGWGCIYSFPGSSWSGSPLSRKKGLLETLAGLTGRAGKMGTPKHTAETPEP